MSENLRNLADWFSQDFDVISGSIEKAVEGFYVQNGDQSARVVIKLLHELIEKHGYSDSLGTCLEAHGWEWFPHRDRTGKSWMQKVIQELNRNIGSIHQN